MKNFSKRSVMPCLASALMVASALVGVVGSTIPVCAATDDGITVLSETDAMSFDKYLVMDKEANVPNASFTFTVSAGEASGDILAGVNPDKVVLTGTSANTIAFQAGDTTKTGANSAIKNYDSSTEKYVQKSATLDFSACNFTEPGTYRYVITETGSNQAVTNDADTTRIVDVYVESTGEPVYEMHQLCNGCGEDFGYGNAAADAAILHISLDLYDDCESYRSAQVLVYPVSIAGYVLHSSTSSTNDKDQGFTNEYDTSNITFRKEVAGNQASYNKYFEFTARITDAVPGTVYDVDLTNADVSVDNHTNPTQLTVGSDGKISQKFYLKHGQEIKINGVAKSSKYSITEDADDYTSTAAGVTNYKDAVSATVASSDIKTSYLNTKEGVVPTGVVMSIAPFATVALLGSVGVGAISIRMKCKQQDEDDDE